MRYASYELRGIERASDLERIPLPDRSELVAGIAGSLGTQGPEEKRHA
jgi:hypothetical protein